MKGSPFTDLQGTWLSNDRFRLDAPFTYHHPDGAITVPAGFVTDFDSVPRIPLAYWLLKGRAVHAPVIHDYLYEAQPVPRREADRLFRHAMADEGIRSTQRLFTWLGVRVGGWVPWRRHRRSAN